MLKVWQVVLSHDTSRDRVIKMNKENLYIVIAIQDRNSIVLDIIHL